MEAKKMMNRGKSKYTYELGKVEPILAATLKPVTPRLEFVSDLRTRVASQPQPLKAQANLWQYALWAGAGLVSGVVLIVTGVRAATAILVALGVIQQVKKSQQTPDSSLKPA